MFRRKQNEPLPPGDGNPPANWDGWTRDVIEKIDGIKGFGFGVTNLSVDWHFHSSNDAEKRSRRDKSASFSGERVTFGRGGDITDIISVDVGVGGTISKGNMKGRGCGCVKFESTDPTGIVEAGKMFRAPRISVELYDFDESLLDTMRQSFISNRLNNSLLIMTIFLDRKVEISEAMLRNELEPSFNIEDSLLIYRISDLSFCERW